MWFNLCVIVSSCVCVFFICIVQKKDWIAGENNDPHGDTPARVLCDKTQPICHGTGWTDSRTGNPGSP